MNTEKKGFHFILMVPLTHSVDFYDPCLHLHVYKLTLVEY